MSKQTAKDSGKTPPSSLGNEKPKKELDLRLFSSKQILKLLFWVLFRPKKFKQFQEYRNNGKSDYWSFLDVESPPVYSGPESKEAVELVKKALKTDVKPLKKGMKPVDWYGCGMISDKNDRP